MKRFLLCLALSLLAIQLWASAALADGVPVVTTLPATNIGLSSAQLNASATDLVSRYGGDDCVMPVLNGNGTGYFQYGTASGVYTSNTPAVNLPAGDPFTFNYTVTTLTPCTKYYVRAVVNLVLLDYQKQGGDSLISFLSSQNGGMHGLGVSLGFYPSGRNINASSYRTFYGNEITFTTGCWIRSPGQGSTGGSTSSVTAQGPVQMANIMVQSAAISTPKVAPGEKVDITASVANRGSSNGDARVTLYVNGQEVESQGITLSSGQTAPLHFYVSRNEPGTYSVYVGGVSAGSFTVDVFTNNDILIYGAIALLTLGIAGVLFMITRRRTA